MRRFQARLRGVSDSDLTLRDAFPFNIQEVFQNKIALVEQKLEDKRIVLIDESQRDFVYADRSMIEIVIQYLQSIFMLNYQLIIFIIPDLTTALTNSN